MKKILIVVIVIWLIFSVYINLFYKGQRMLCKMPLVMAAGILIPFFAGIFWIGLPFSYILKFIYSKFRRLISSNNQILRIFFSIFEPVMFIFLLPFVFGIFIFYKVFPSLSVIITGSNYLFFFLQFSGLFYIYLSLSGLFNKYLLK